MSDEQPATNQSSERPAGVNLITPITVSILLIGALTYSLQAAELLQNFVGFFLAPSIGGIFMSIWWLASVRVPMRDRLVGLGLAIAVVAIVVVTHGISSGPYLGSFAIIAIVLTTTAAFLLTAKMAWPQRRLAALAAVLGCLAVFSLLRLDSVGGDLAPNVSWVWTDPPAAEWADEIENPAKTAALPAAIADNDWPAFRGPLRNSHVPGVTFATDWEANPPKEIWRQPIGLGFSSYAAVGDYLFTQEQRGTQELVVCYNANTGEEVWINQTQARFEDGTGDGPRATPTYLDGKLYTQGAKGLLQCLDAATGEVIWDTNLRDDTGADLPQWGFASSPLIVGDLLFVFAGGPDDRGAAAYNIDNGELAWNAGEGTHGYTSAHLVNFAGTEQVLITSDVGVQSFVPGDGELLWDHEWAIRMNPRCVQPIIPEDDALLIGTAGGQGTRRINIAKTGEGWTVDEQWTTKRFKPYFNDSIYHDGHVYGYDGNRLMCIDAATGDVVWRGERYGGQVLFLPDMEMLLAITEKGEVLLVEATPEAFNVVTRFQAIEGKTWNHPVIAHGRLYVRNASEAAAFELPQP